MQLSCLRNLLTVLLIGSFFTSGLKASDNGQDKKRTLNKESKPPSYRLLNVNNISTYFYNNGESDLDLTGNSGFSYPKWSHKRAFFMSGLVWGGKIGNEVKVNGSTYNSGLQPGRILLPDGRPEDPSAARIYRVKRNYKNDDLSSEINDGEGTKEAIRAQYERDWNDWPASEGAPFEDIDHDGRYSPGTDIPGVAGADQTIWYAANDLDDSASVHLYGSKPIGIEMQTTLWAYKVPGGFSNMIFRDYKLINKSRNKIDSMYVMMWSDPDLGDAGDDLVGCDTLLNLGYCYNGQAFDYTYNDTPPAVGFCLLEGPAVKGDNSDTAWFMGRKIRGMKNLPMTSFTYLFKNLNSAYGYFSEPVMGGDYKRGTLLMYNAMQGKDNNGNLFKVPGAFGGGVTRFLFSGDPAKGTGFAANLPESGDKLSDHRMSISSGPFTMAPGDTQQVIFAQIAAGGPRTYLNNLESITKLKQYASSAAKMFDGSLDMPSAPPAPKVEASELDRQIILNWGADQAKVEATECYNKKGFQFEGYNVYQLPSATSTMKEAQRIATFDRINDVKYIVNSSIDSASGLTLSQVQQFGSDSGIERFLKVSRDQFTNMTLINGKKYYFAVTSYSYSSSSEIGTNNLENTISDIITLTPHSSDPGVKYNFLPGDTINLAKTSGTSEGRAVALVIDPNRVNGHQYKVEFENISGSLHWNLRDVTEKKLKVKGQSNQSGNNDYLITDGIMVKVIDVPAGIKPGDMLQTSSDRKNWGWDVAGGQENLKWTWVNANVSGYGLEAFGANAGSPEYGNALSSGMWWGTSLSPDKYKNVMLKFASTDTAGNLTDPNDPNASYAYRYMRGCQNLPAKSEFSQYIINKSSSYDFQDYKKTFPFAAYDTESDPPRRLSVGFLENNVSGGLVDGKYWPLNSAYASRTNGNSSVNSPREWFFIFDVPYSDQPDASLARNINNIENPLPVMYLGMPNRLGNAKFLQGDQFAIFPNHINTERDAWTFNAPSVLYDDKLAKEDVNKINVFPNPYYAVNPQELNKYRRFVTFSHLPQRADIRIFNLAGQLVRTIKKDSPGQFITWDLLNEAHFQVGSGLYIVHIDMPQLGKTKTLKLAVIQELIIPDYY